MTRNSRAALASGEAEVAHFPKEAGEPALGVGRARPRFGEPRRAAENEVRCCCGSLLARWLPEGLELKCRRCKHAFVVPFETRVPGASDETVQFRVLQPARPLPQR
jgi:hypothetical protein